MDKLDILKSIDFGQPVAEQEAEKLDHYFVETNQWRQVYNDDVDVVYGPKGSGKSAIYSLINKHEPEFFQDNIVLRFAENPRGTTAFSDLQVDPPPSERAFVNLWKLYFLVLVGEHFQAYGTQTNHGKDVLMTLKESELLPEEKMLKVILGRVKNYIAKYFNPHSFEPNATFNDSTGGITNIGLKIVFNEPDDNLSKKGAKSVDTLLSKANLELKETGFKIWFLLDRLDVAFTESPELEENALRALFKAYLDFLNYEYFKLKIFLRSDIWSKITKEGFREATHITKHTTIDWNRDSLLNLVVKRLMNSQKIITAYKEDKEVIFSDLLLQEDFFYRVFPRKVDSGNNPDTLDWIIGRTKDSLGVSAPRDIINLVNGAIESQIKAFELGNDLTEGETLISRSSLKAGLTFASKEKTEKYLFAEYPDLRNYFEALRGNKSRHSIESLSQLWACPKSEAETVAKKIAETGFWTIDRTSNPYWIQFIFRDGLGLIQGTA